MLMVNYMFGSGLLVIFVFGVLLVCVGVGEIEVGVQIVFVVYV